MNQKIIFHHPGIINLGSSGSQIRPIKMMSAFKAIGYEVDSVMGYGAERKKQINNIKNEVLRGVRYGFVYSESSTMPTLLTEKRHLPVYPWLDFGFFQWAKKNKIPIGLFYRDIHWKFPSYKKKVFFSKRLFTIPMYWYDLLRYQNLLNHLFLPSLKMSKVLPIKWPQNKVSALPPGCDINDIKIDDKPCLKKKMLNLFYVGGVVPPLYNLTPLFETICNMKNIRLTICCRKKEWDEVDEYYNTKKYTNVKIVHENHGKLKKYYLNADIFAMLWGKNSYLDFAMPVKLFETIGYAVPIIMLTGTEAARFVNTERIGWVVKNTTEARKTLEWLYDNPQEIKKKKKEIYSIRERHSWEERAKQVVDILLEVKK